MQKTTEILPQIFENEKFFCPMCHDYFPESDYLKTVIKDKKTLWLANMVTHYRHNHIKWWDRCWGPNGGYYQGNWFNDYDEQKEKVNEQAKRQIIRKCTPYLQGKNINLQHFQGLENNDQKTIELIKNKLK